MLANFNSVIDLLAAFPTEKECIEFLEQQRWADGVVSPFDEKAKVWKCKSGVYQCKNTGKNFKFYCLKTSTYSHRKNKLKFFWSSKLCDIGLISN